jgi:hypothetical protein
VSLRFHVIANWTHPDPERDREVKADISAWLERFEKDPSIRRRYCEALLDTLLSEQASLGVVRDRTMKPDALRSVRSRHSLSSSSTVSASKPDRVHDCRIGKPNAGIGTSQGAPDAMPS